MSDRNRTAWLRPSSASPIHPIIWKSHFHSISDLSFPCGVPSFSLYFHFFAGTEIRSFLPLQIIVHFHIIFFVVYLILSILLSHWRVSDSPSPSPLLPFSLSFWFNWFNWFNCLYDPILVGRRTERIPQLGGLQDSHSHCCAFHFLTRRSDQIILWTHWKPQWESPKPRWVLPPFRVPTISSDALLCVPPVRRDCPRPSTYNRPTHVLMHWDCIWIHCNEASDWDSNVEVLSPLW